MSVSELDSVDFDARVTSLVSTGEAVPKWMDGRIRGDIYDNPQDPTWDNSPEPGSGGGEGGDGFSDEESAAIEESLRGLGYLQ